MKLFTPLTLCIQFAVLFASCTPARQSVYKHPKGEKNRSLATTAVKRKAPKAPVQPAPSAPYSLRDRENMACLIRTAFEIGVFLLLTVLEYNRRKKASRRKLAGRTGTRKV